MTGRSRSRPNSYPWTLTHDRLAASKLKIRTASTRPQRTARAYISISVKADTRVDGKWAQCLAGTFDTDVRRRRDCVQWRAAYFGGASRQVHRVIGSDAGGIISSVRDGNADPFVSASNGLRTPMPPTFSTCV